MNHRCIDNRRYLYSCLVSDPDCHKTAIGYMKAAIR